MAHNKYLTFLFLEDNDPILAKSAAQVLSWNLAKTFPLLNFLITGLCNSSGGCSFTLHPNPVLVSKVLSEIVLSAKPLLSEYDRSWARQALSNSFWDKCFKLQVCLYFWIFSGCLVNSPQALLVVLHAILA